MVKLQAMQNSKNNAPQVYLQGRLFLLFYTAPAVHEAPRRGANGAWLVSLFISAILNHIGGNFAVLKNLPNFNQKNKLQLGKKEK